MNLLFQIDGRPHSDIIAVTWFVALGPAWGSRCERFRSLVVTHLLRVSPRGSGFDQLTLFQVMGGGLSIPSHPCGARTQVRRYSVLRIGIYAR